jgi:hypothetical protein
MVPGWGLGGSNRQSTQMIVVGLVSNFPTETPLRLAHITKQQPCHMEKVSCLSPFHKVWQGFVVFGMSWVM